MMAETVAELRALSDEELVTRHDQQALRTAVGTNHYLDELARRGQERQNDRMLEYTLSIERLTRVVTIATIVNVVAAIIATTVSAVALLR